MVLRTVVSQQMVPDNDGNIIPAFELMHVNTAIRTMIRDNKNHQIENAIIAGRSEGMLTMDSSLLELYSKGIISKTTALNYANNPDQLYKHLS
jgi:twitching motility protein PilT